MRIPTATYRLQFNPTFGFLQAKQLIAYLKKMGISDLYASPIFMARRGSMHGYDVTDPGRLNPELGASEDFKILAKEISDRSMGWVQDIVPNHMAFDGQNAWLMDILEKEDQSEYWNFFDIEWKDTYQSLKGKILTPFLGQFYSQCLENKQIQIKYGQNGLSVNYFDLSLPLNVKTYNEVFLLNKDKLKQELDNRPKTYSNYINIVHKFNKCPKKKSITDHIYEIKRMLWDLYAKDPIINRHIKRNISNYNGTNGRVNSFESLDQLLSKQLFRLTFWKFGSEEINYRRFFNINQLISMKVEESKVFNRTHELIFDLIQKEQVTGLRIDHIDGLYDPKKYLDKLRGAFKSSYIVVEKILDHDERIPASWPVEGTTGYDFLNNVNGVFIDQANETILNGYYQKIIADTCSFDDLVNTKKRLIIGKHMAGDVDNLSHHMKRISHKDRYGRDITSYGLKRALVEVLTFFPVYRTYVDSNGIHQEDQSIIMKAVKKAKENNPGLVYELDFIADILLLNFKNYLSEQEKINWKHYVRRFQQFTGPLMAKGFEDTALYVYNRFLSLNEVGGSPDRFGVSLKEFHKFHLARNKKTPHSMSATATHDTKRGEDIRARMNVLSEIPHDWMKKVNAWQKSNYDKKTKVAGKLAPDSNDEYFLYQTLIGGFPFKEGEIKEFKGRLKEYIIKAVREAKVHTAWIQPDEEYEVAYSKFIDELLKSSKNNAFYKDFVVFQKEVAHYGVFNSLSQILIKMTSPGVPDFYQGCELWDFHFVDPDNRRPVDFRLRQQWLEKIIKDSQKDNTKLIKILLKNKNNGHIKLYLIWKILQLRNQLKDVFQCGQYIPLQVKGKYRENIIAFARKHNKKMTVIITPRFLTNVVNKNQNPIGSVWKNTAINLPKKHQFKDKITDALFNRKVLYIRDIFKHFPGAVLTNDDEKG